MNEIKIHNAELLFEILAKELCVDLKLLKVVNPQLLEVYELGYKQAIKEIIKHLEKAINFLNEKSVEIEKKDRASQVAWELRQKAVFFEEAKGEIEQQIWRY
jgi:hypothetical protein